LQARDKKIAIEIRRKKEFEIKKTRVTKINKINAKDNSSI